MITFVIPAYNSQETIAACIESVLSQEVKKEIIVIDNASNDNTPKIIKRYPVKYYYEEKKGPAAARNRGILEANKESDFIAFIDSDVILTEKWSENGLKLLQENGSICGVGGPGKSIIKNRISQIFDVLPFGGNIGKEELQYVKCLPTMNVVLKKAMINDLSFNEYFNSAEDGDFSFRLRKLGYKLGFSQELCVYHHNPTTLYDVIKRWYKYGTFYPLPYFLNDEVRDLTLWIRILYLPVLIGVIVSGTYNNMFNILAIIMVLSIFFFYAAIGVKAKIKSLKEIILFSSLHSIKQFVHCVGIWHGIINRKFRMSI